MPNTGPEPAARHVHVAAAAMLNADNEVLLALRHADAHQGGLWEFPGGKLEPGESVEQGLHRELHEELGVRVSAHRPLIRVRHDYPDRSVLLDVHRVDAWQGEPHGREDQPLRWVPVEQLGEFPMPPADVPIVRALQLPDTYLITPPEIDDGAALLHALEQRLAAGTALLQLRLFDLSRPELMSLGQAVCRYAHGHGARVLLNGGPDDAQRIGADGIHRSSRRLLATDSRPLGPEGLVAASCHSLDELRHAAALGADFVVLSPVLPTRSHPDAEPLGWERFAAWVDAVNLPVFALGGMTSAERPTAWRHGAQGIAGIRGLWV